MDDRQSWGQFVERQIREAIERGDFDNLPGAGQPLDLTEPPFVPADLRLVFRMLKRAGFAPEWIELDKELRDEIPRCELLLSRHKEWLGQAVAQLPQAGAREQSPPAQRVARAVTRLRAAHQRFLAEHEARLADLNRKIERFNWLAPTPRLHRQPVRLAPEWRGLLEQMLRERGVSRD